MFVNIFNFYIYYILFNLSFCFLSFYESRFLTGPANLKDPDAKFRFPRIFVNTKGSYEELHLIVYKVRVLELSDFVR